MEDEAFTQLSVRVAAALREYVKLPDQWELRPFRMGAEDDPDAPLVFWVRINHPFRNDVIHIEEYLSPDLLEFGVGGIEGIIHLLAIHWQAKFTQAELKATRGAASQRGDNSGAP